MRKFLKNNLIVLILLNGANGFNYLFQIIVARSFTPDQYGLFNALNSMVVILSAPIGVLPMVFSKATIRLALLNLQKVKSLIIEGGKVLSLFASGILLLGLVFTPLIRDYLHLDYTSPIIFMFAKLIVALYFPMLFGVLQGLERFTAFGIGSGGVNIVRFLFGVLLVLSLGWGINGALIAGILGGVFGIMLGLWALRDILSGAQPPLPEGCFSEMKSYGLKVLLATGLTMVMGNIDIILVRHYCSPEEAGFYSTASILGRIALFVPATLIAVIFPQAALDHEKGQKGTSNFWVGMGLTFVLGGGYALVCFFWGGPLIGLMFGEQYVESAYLLQVVSLAMAVLALTNVIFTYHLARSDFGFLWPLAGGVVFFVVAILGYHDSAFTIAKILLLSITLIFLVILIPHLTKARRLIFSN